jgi:hypothetical protein
VSLLYWSFQTKGKAVMRRNSEISAILIRAADTARKIQPKSTWPFQNFTLFAVFLKNLQKIHRKTVTPQIYPGLHIMERISESYRPGHVAHAILSFIHHLF